MPRAIRVLDCGNKLLNQDTTEHPTISAHKPLLALGITSKPSN